MNRPTMPICGKPLKYDDEEGGMRWGQYIGAYGDMHCIPQNDDKEHSLNPNCWCKPDELNNRMFSHNSYDRREDYEKGYRKAN